MDTRTTIFCIALVACALFAYLAGRADEKRKTRSEIANLKKALILAVASQDVVKGYLKSVENKVLSIRDAVAGIGEMTNNAAEEAENTAQKE